MAVVKKAREEAGLTQRELAGRMGVAQSLIGRLETGQRSLALTELIAFAEAIKSDPQDLLGRVMVALKAVEDH